MRETGKELEDVVEYEATELEDISTTYNNTTTTETSQEIDISTYRYATLVFTLDSTNTPTDIEFSVEISADGTNFFKMINNGVGHWVYDDTICATAINEGYTFPIAAQLIRIRVVALGTSASNTFEVSDAYLYLRN